MIEHGVPAAKPSISQNLLFTLTITALGIYASAFGSVADYLAESFGQKAAMAGVYLSIYGAGSCVSAFFGGSLGDRLGKRRVIVCAMAVLCLGLIAVSGAPNLPLTLAGLFLAGIGFGPSESMSSAVLTDENPHNATRWMNISQIGFGVGAIGAPIVAVKYCTQWGGTYRGVFAFCAGMVAVLGAAIWLTARGRAVRTNASGGMNGFALLRDRRFLLCALMVFFYLGFESVAPITFKQLFLASGATDNMAAFSISLFWGSMLVCRFIGVFLNGKELVSIKVCCLIVLAGIAVLLLSTSDVMRLVGVFLYGFGCGPIWPMLFVLSSRAFPERSGAAYGVMMLFSTAGNSIFPALIGTGAQSAQITFMLCAVLVALLLAGALLASAARTPRRRGSR